MADAFDVKSGARDRQRSKLIVCFLLGASFFVVELFAGLLTGSLALLSDAAHMLTDVLGLGMSLAAVHLSSRISASPQRSFGLYRLEILAALGNGLLLFGVGIFVVIEAYRRIFDPPSVPGAPILIVAGIGLAVNLFSYFLLRPEAERSLNIKAASLEVLADAIGSVGAVFGGLVLTITGWPYIDPIVGAAIGVWILPRTYRLTREAFRILVQAAPPEIDARQLEQDLCCLEGVAGVHDLHVWTLASGMEVASMHIRLNDDADPVGVMKRARSLLERKYRLVHSTLQLDPAGQECRGCCW